MSLSKQELFDRIRRDSWQQQMSIRALSRKYGVHRRLVREALASPVPAPRRRPARTSPRMEPYKKTVDARLRADLEAPRKQRHTVRLIVARIEEEFGEAIPYPTVRDFVAARRKEIAAQAGAPVEAFMTWHNALGADAEVGFGDVYVDLIGQRTRCHLFAFRLAYSGKAVHRIFRSCGRQSFFEKHVHALTVLGGVLAGQIRYDNLTPAVRRVVFRSRSREEDPRWIHFHEYYGFTPFYCEPGLRGAHEKGGVEGPVGYFRRNYLTSVSRANSLEELKARLAGFETREGERRIGARIRTIGRDFAREAPHRLPLSDAAFTTGITLTPRVDRYGMITVKMCRYSVLVRFIDRKVVVTLTCDELTVHDGQREIARHPRLAGRSAERLVIDHHLEALLTEPGALERSEALHQARAAGGTADRRRTDHGPRHAAASTAQAARSHRIRARYRRQSRGRTRKPGVHRNAVVRARSHPPARTPRDGEPVSVGGDDHGQDTSRFAHYRLLVRTLAPDTTVVVARDLHASDASFERVRNVVLIVPGGDRGSQCPDRAQGAPPPGADGCCCRPHRRRRLRSALARAVGQPHRPLQRGGTPDDGTGPDARRDPGTVQGP